MWSAVAALWRYRCEVRYDRMEPSKESFNAFWMSELGHWGREEPTRVHPRSAQRLRQAIRQWMQYRRKPAPISDPGLPQRIDKRAEQKRRKEKCKQEVVDKYNLNEDPPQGVQRVWIDGSQQTGKDGRPYAG